MGPLFLWANQLFNHIHVFFHRNSLRAPWVMSSIHWTSFSEFFQYVLKRWTTSFGGFSKFCYTTSYFLCNYFEWLFYHTNVNVTLKVENVTRIDKSWWECNYLKKHHKRKKLYFKACYMQLWKWQICSKYYCRFSDYMWWNYKNCR